MLIEITTFVTPSEVEAFLEVDADAQAEMSSWPGMLRRTTARGDRRWVVITLWASEEYAKPQPEAFLDLVGDVSVECYETLD